MQYECIWVAHLGIMKAKYGVKWELSGYFKSIWEHKATVIPLQSIFGKRATSIRVYYEPK